MPVQSIDLSQSTLDATFNGSTVEQINLNGAGIWTMPPKGPPQWYTSLTLTNSWVTSDMLKNGVLAPVNPAWTSDLETYFINPLGPEGLMYLIHWRGNIYPASLISGDWTYDFRGESYEEIGNSASSVAVWASTYNALQIATWRVGWKDTASMSSDPENRRHYTLDEAPLIDTNSDGTLKDKDFIFSKYEWQEANSYTGDPAGYLTQTFYWKVRSNSIKLLFEGAVYSSPTTRTISQIESSGGLSPTKELVWNSSTKLISGYKVNGSYTNVSGNWISNVTAWDPAVNATVMTINGV
jgi:hypothetical protein